ncbi:hypothetical protein D9M73_191360 [compost metagenome]
MPAVLAGLHGEDWLLAGLGWLALVADTADLLGFFDAACAAQAAAYARWFWWLVHGGSSGPHWSGTRRSDQTGREKPAWYPPMRSN